MLAKDASGKTREGFNFIEKQSAYGITFKGGNQFTVVSLSAHLLTIKKNDSGKFEAHTAEGRLVRVFVQMTTGWVPSVDYVEMYIVGADGKETVKKIKN